MSYAVNDNFLDEAFRVTVSDLNEKPLVPHILTKNVKFEVNFGQADPWFPALEGFVWIAKVPMEERVAGPKRPQKRGDCEVAAELEVLPS